MATLVPPASNLWMTTSLESRCRVGGGGRGQSGSSRRVDLLGCQAHLDWWPLNSRAGACFGWSDRVSWAFLRIWPTRPQMERFHPCVSWPQDASGWNPQSARSAHPGLSSVGGVGALGAGQALVRVLSGPRLAQRAWMKSGRCAADMMRPV